MCSVLSVFPSFEHITWSKLRNEEGIMGPYVGGVGRRIAGYRGYEAGSRKMGELQLGRTKGSQSR